CLVKIRSHLRVRQVRIRRSAVRHPVSQAPGDVKRKVRGDAASDADVSRTVVEEFRAQKSVEPFWPRAYHDTIMKHIPSLRVIERALRDRDPSFDGIFFVAVRTTGIFCRPSCPAKTALARNRRFFPSAQEALRAGFRPCRRCRPLNTNGQPPTWVQELLQQIDRDRFNRMTDAALRNLGMEPARVRRHSRNNYGTPY